LRRTFRRGLSQRSTSHLLRHQYRGPLNAKMKMNREMQ
jgi:hypothetical protein